MLSMFVYDAGARAPCDAHTDYTLLTVVPVGAGGGLEVLDIGTMEMRKVEAEAAATGRPCVVVMAGELLEHVSNRAVMACTHAVTPYLPAPRVSSPFLFHGAAAHVVDVAALMGVDSAVDGCRNVETVASVVGRLQAQRESVIYGGAPELSAQL